jgi:hypothetical protein
MSEKDSIESQPKTFDIPRLLNFGGPSTRKQEPIADGMALIGFRSTDQNETNISLLLSSQGIPFYMRQDAGWGGTERHMFLVVPTDHYQDAIAVLKAAAKADRVELAEGHEGLLSY